jgi:adenosylcobinamide-GDP ribazoletransferase
VAVGIAAVLTGWWTPGFVVIAGVGVAATGLLAAHKIGGVTGDVLGAAQQVSEIGILLLAVIFSTA